MTHKYTVKVNSLGNVLYLRDGAWHRDVDKPAVIWADGRVWYCKDGKCHRDGDLPAIIWADGSVSYWKNGKCYAP